MTPSTEPRVRSPERLAYWYFRLNGFLTTENFIIHPDTGTDQRTDADLFAVRFSNRGENFVRSMKDDPRVSSCPTFANIIIAEVKRGWCELNNPWTKPELGTMKRALKALGCLPDRVLDLACDQLYRQGIWTDSLVTIRLFSLGETRAEGLCIPADQQITWDEILAFCIERFRNYRRQKSSVGQWTEEGKQLRAYALSDDPQANIRRLFGLCSHPDLTSGS